MSSVQSLGYACDVQSFKLSSPDDRDLTRVTGTHETGKMDDDVVDFYNEGKIKNFFLQNIKKFFKNVQKVTFAHANLSTLSKFDLKPFGSQLTVLRFHYNNLEAIESDLFEFTPNLYWINLQNNQLKFVGKGTFSNLQELTRFYFSNNPCHSFYTEDRSLVIKLISIIESKCTDTQALERQRKLNPTTTTTEMPTTTTTTEKNCAVELQIEITNLTNDHKQKIDELNSKHEAEIKIKNAETEKLKKEIESLKQVGVKSEEFKELVQKISNMEINISQLLSISSKDTSSEQFTSINATCNALEYKIDLLNKDCVSKPFCRQP